MKNLLLEFTQIQCQIKSFNVQIKILVLIICISFISCISNTAHKLDSDFDIQIDRFEKKFFKISEDSITILINEYPFLFSNEFDVSNWVEIKRDSTRNYIYKKTVSLFEDTSIIENDIKKIFSKAKDYFPDFVIPKIITLNNGIDYKYNLIDSDSIILLSLDCYLDDELLYANIPKHISDQMNPNFISNDINELISSRFVEFPSDRKFISKIIYHGKLLFLMSKLSENSTNKLLGYNKIKSSWINENEKEVWKYFIENDLLFSTKSSLDYRFLANAPFSKFGLSIDYQSPPMVGRWLGFQIVESFSKKSTKNLLEILAYDNYKLYLESNYKP
mgnify:CR=1 FL=1